MLPSILAVALCCLPPAALAGAGWNYKGNSHSGPDHWKDSYPDCGGVMQSPINVVTQDLLYDPSLMPFDFTDYAKENGVHVDLHNVGGHTVEVMYSGSPIYLTGGSLPMKYQLDQFHFHWGSSDAKGSEHAVNGHHFPMEMHLVHHRADQANISVAAPHAHGLAVIGFFFEIGEYNANFDVIFNHLDKIKYPGNHSDIPIFKLIDLLPTSAADMTLHYYRYMGSLTTPPCYETIIWTLPSETIKISEAQVSKTAHCIKKAVVQINKMRSLYNDGQGHRLVDDFRPMQELHQRTVTTNIEPDINVSSKTAVSSLVLVLGLSLALGRVASL